MVYGIVQGGVVQLWTRSGPTELGVRALATCQELPGDYSGFIRKVTKGGATPVFEYIGRQSHQKASLYEQKHADVVLLAIRSNAMGCYWTYDQMADWAAVFRIQVVQRMDTLELRAEMCGLEDIVEEVEGFHNCEGVVVRFEDGGWLKIKSKWWQKAGYVKYKTERVREQIVKAKDTVKKKGVAATPLAQDGSHYVEVQRQCQGHQGVVSECQESRDGTQQCWSAEACGACV